MVRQKYMLVNNTKENAFAFSENLLNMSLNVFS